MKHFLLATTILVISQTSYAMITRSSLTKQQGTATSPITEFDGFDEAFTCSKSECSEIFDSLDELNLHIQTHIISTVEYRCGKPSCKRTFRNQHAVNSHMRTHLYENQSSLICGLDGCTKEFKYKSLLKRHRESKKHSPDTFKCSDSRCQKIYNSKCALTKHLFKGHRTQHTCSACNATFSSLPNLQEHQNSSACIAQHLVNLAEKQTAAAALLEFAKSVNAINLSTEPTLINTDSELTALVNSNLSH